MIWLFAGGFVIGGILWVRVVNYTTKEDGQGDLEGLPLVCNLIAWPIAVALVLLVVLGSYVGRFFTVATTAKIPVKRKEKVALISSEDWTKKNHETERELGIRANWCECSIAHDGGPDDRCPDPINKRSIKRAAWDDEDEWQEVEPVRINKYNYDRKYR